MMIVQIGMRKPPKNIAVIMILVWISLVMKSNVHEVKNPSSTNLFFVKRGNEDQNAP